MMYTPAENALLDKINARLAQVERLELVTPETLDAMRKAHGEHVRIGTIVRIREPAKYDPAQWGKRDD